MRSYRMTEEETLLNKTQLDKAFQGKKDGKLNDID